MTYFHSLPRLVKGNVEVSSSTLKNGGAKHFAAVDTAVEKAPDIEATQCSIYKTFASTLYHNPYIAASSVFAVASILSAKANPQVVGTYAAGIGIGTAMIAATHVLKSLLDITYSSLSTISMPSYFSGATSSDSSLKSTEGTSVEEKSDNGTSTLKVPATPTVCFFPEDYDLKFSPKRHEAVKAPVTESSVEEKEFRPSPPNENQDGVTTSGLLNIVKAAYRGGKFKNGEELGEGWTVVRNPDAKYGLNIVAVVNEEKAQIIFGVGGHVLVPQWFKPLTWLDFALEFVQDTKSVLSIAGLHQDPAQYQPAVDFVQSILDSHSNGKKMDITFTGHSMGGPLAELLAIQFSNNDEAQSAKSVVFEGIGSRDVAVFMFGEEIVEAHNIGNSASYALSPNAFTKATSQTPLVPVTLVDPNGKDSFFNLRHGIHDLEKKLGPDGHFAHQVPMPEYTTLPSMLSHASTTCSHLASNATDYILYALNFLGNKSHTVYSIGSDAADYISYALNFLDNKSHAVYSIGSKGIEAVRTEGIGPLVTAGIGALIVTAAETVMPVLKKSDTAMHIASGNDQDGMNEYGISLLSEPEKSLVPTPTYHITPNSSSIAPYADSDLDSAQCDLNEALNITIVDMLT